MTAGLNQMLLARDVYRSWKGLVKGAKQSVRVFTPYLDRMLDRLLSNSVLEVGDLSVVTDLSPESGALDYRGQLIGVRAMLRRGIEVRSLPRLHAKVIVCDGNLVTVGSQNFTSYGRSSKETTAVLSDDVSNSEFARTLEEWYVAATPVSLELIELLLAELVEATEVAREAREHLTNAFDAQWNAYLEMREQEHKRLAAAQGRPPLASQLADAVQISTERQARSLVWAKLTAAGEWDEYETLLADKDSTLTHWLTRAYDGAVSFAPLERLSFYPIVLNPSGRMAFGRVAQTRITYVRDSVKWTRPREILGGSYGLTVRFPSDGLESSNLHMELSVSGQPAYATLELRLRFDGLEATLTDWEIQANSSAGAYAAHYVGSQSEYLHALADQLHESLEELVASAFAPFTLSELGVGNHNADEFFPRGWVRVALVDYGARRVLVVTPHTA